MATNSKKRILILITNSYAATNVIHSSLIKSIADEYEVYILSTLITEKNIAEINQHFQINIQKMNLNIPTESSLIRMFRRCEKAIFSHLFEIETQQIKNRNKGFYYELGSIFAFWLLDFFGITTPIIKFLRKKIISISANNTSCKKLLAYNFDGVLSSSPLDIRENTIVNFTNKRSIPSLAIIISWDNLTSKGIINADHDYVLTWNQLMADEYQQFYNLFETRNQTVCIAGVPRFDKYFNNDFDKFSHPEFRKRYEIDLYDKVILFTTSAVIHFPNQIDIVKHLLEYAIEKPNIKIIVRCHAGDDFEVYRDLENISNLKIWYPENIPDSRSTSQWMPDLEILDILTEMLKYCDVCINVASTIRLEAAACNKPSISIAYDGDLKQPYQKSVKRLYDYSHQIPLNEAGIDIKVHSKNELFKSLDKLLIEPSATKPKYTRQIQKFIHYSGPFAIPETMKYIRQWLN